MWALIVESWAWLFYFDCLMRLRGFNALYDSVRRHQPPPGFSHQTGQERISHAVDLACVFYFKRVLCLQRSAATAVLMRSRGWKAEMVIGAQLLPFQSHAWVEIDGRVVNDKPYICETFQVLDRC